MCILSRYPGFSHAVIFLCFFCCFLRAILEQDALSLFSFQLFAAPKREILHAPFHKMQRTNGERKYTNHTPQNTFFFACCIFFFFTLWTLSFNSSATTRKMTMICKRRARQSTPSGVRCVSSAPSSCHRHRRHHTAADRRTSRRFRPGSAARCSRCRLCSTAQLCATSTRRDRLWSGSRRRPTRG